MSTNGSYEFPPDLYYDGATHVWVREEGPVVRVGLDAIALDLFGDLAYISLADAGSAVQRGQAMGSVEAAKMVDDLIAPVSGTIAARNEALLRDTSPVNSDPYGTGWLVTIAPSDWGREAAQLVHGEGLAAWVQAEMERLAS